jgi:hypothetical protein
MRVWASGRIASGTLRLADRWSRLSESAARGWTPQAVREQDRSWNGARIGLRGGNWTGIGVVPNTTVGGLVIDCDEDRTFRAVLVDVEGGRSISVGPTVPRQDRLDENSRGLAPDH